MKRFLQFIIYTVLLKISFAQPKVTVIADQLSGPLGIEVDDEGNVWIAEQGQGNFTSSITVVWKDGTVQKVVDSLVSIVNTIEGGFVGAERIQFLDENTFAVAGLVDTIFGSHGLLFFDRNEVIKGGTPLTPRDALSIVPTAKEIIRRGSKESHNFSVLADGCDLLICDAAANAILRRDGLTGAYTPFSTFGPTPNPTPIGAPFIDPVPTKIIRNPDGGYYVSNFSGFPFLENQSAVYKMDDNGNTSIFHDGLTLIIDIVTAPDGDGLYALQMCKFDLNTFSFALNSGQVLHLHEDGSKDTIFSNFGPTAGLALDSEGNCYLTHLFFGLAIKVEGKTTKVKEDPLEIKFSLSPNPVNDQIHIMIPDKIESDKTIIISDMTGRVFKKLNTIKNNLIVDVSDYASGTYLCTIIAKNKFSSEKFIKN